ncbi:MAG TPA: Rnase Y domain-containing protein, partial [Spirochaetota bacterium]|nr:Rnase Y domain-containing protein [Spirochaetota bacterium]
MELTTLLLIIVLSIMSGIAGFALRAYLGKIKLSSAESRSIRIVQDAVKEADAKRKELLIE